MTETQDRLSQEEAQQRAAQISDVAYDLELDLEAGAKTFKGVVTISFRHSGGDTFLELGCLAQPSLFNLFGLKSLGEAEAGRAPHQPPRRHQRIGHHVGEGRCKRNSPLYRLSVGHHFGT